jgi:DNA-binding transcriptional MocR family regulator
MTAQLPEWKLEMPAGGLSVWAELPEAISTGIAATARRYGLSVAAGPRFGVNGAFERFMRLPYTQPGEVLEQAVNRLARTFEAIRSSAKISSGDPAVI